MAATHLGPEEIPFAVATGAEMATFDGDMRPVLLRDAVLEHSVSGDVVVSPDDMDKGAG